MVRAGALIFLAALAGAHEVKSPQRDRLELSPSRARLTIEYLVPPADAPSLKQIFRGRDLTAYLVQQATHFAQLAVDGKNVQLHIDSVKPFDLGVIVELSAAIDRPRHVRFADRHKDRRINVPVELVLQDLRAKAPLGPLFVFADHPLELDLQ